MVQLKKALKKYFGFDEFRSGQDEAVKSILNCKDTLTIFPTGGGKSLCYQLPALILEGTVIVISPLIALMKDQVDSLNRNNIPAATINSSLPFELVQEYFMRAVNGEYKLLYISPERLESRTFLRMLKMINIPFIAVDEAHCISEWGHDFRAAYLNIRNIFEHIPRCPIMALTATATQKVQEDIIKSLSMEEPTVLITGFDRKNLSYITKITNDKISAIAEITAQTKEGSTIIYTGTRREAEELTETLSKYCGITTESYHAGKRDSLRTAVQERFLSGKTPVIVATNAFGMGIDKEDVRNVIHTYIPLTLEAYYQEAGRAGRDGKPSNCYIFTSESDYKLPYYFINHTYPTPFHVYKVLDIVLNISREQSNENTNSGLDLDPISIANKLQINEQIVRSVFSFLIRLKILGKGSMNGQCKIHITASRERISEYFSNQTPELQEALEALLRSVSSDVFQRKTAFKMKDIILKHSVSNENLSKLIEGMKLYKLIEFESEKESAGYYLNSTNFDSEFLEHSINEQIKRWAFALHKLENVFEYVHTNTCKRNYILNYFNDKHFTGKCGKCSSCNSQQPATSNYSFLKYIILNKLEGFTSPISKSRLTDILTKQFNSNRSNSNVNNISNDDLKSLIRSEIKNLSANSLVYSGNKFDISITILGKEFLSIYRSSH